MRLADKRIVLVAVAALIARVLFVLLWADRSDPPPSSDRDFFVEGARLLADGEGFVHPFVHDALGVDEAATAAHPPLWIAMLAPLAKLGLLTPMSARIVACVAGAVAVLLIGLIARRLAGPTAGVVTAAVAAAYPAWLVADGSGMAEPLYLALAAGAVLSLLRSRSDHDGRRALLAGGLIGLAALTRTEGLLLLPFVAVPLLWARWRLVGLATLAVVVTVLPWTVRNAVTLDRFIPISTNVATVLAGANCDETYSGPDIGLWSIRCLSEATGDEVTFPLRAYDEGRLAEAWQSSGLDYAADHAERLPAVVAARVARLWRLWRPLREGDETEGVGVTAGRVAALSFLLVLLPLAVLAACRRRLRREHLMLLAGLAAMVTLTSAAGWGAPRFLRPAELGLVLAAGVLLAGRARAS